jgi:hypothetical protein
MLNVPRSNSNRVHRRQSLRRGYEEFIEQRIEEYKDQISRQRLLAIADEAVRELEVHTEDQLVLTEVLLLDHVDRLIKKRLRLPSFRRWRERYVRLREAQRQPTHWGVEPDSPLPYYAACVEEGDVAIIVGAGAASAGFYLAAHEAQVYLIDQELALVEAAEGRAAAEGLSNRFEGLVVNLGGWLPDVAPALVMVDMTAVGRVREEALPDLVANLMHQTLSGGVHIISPPPPSDEPVELTPQHLEPHYGEWESERNRDAAHQSWFLARKP